MKLDRNFDPKLEDIINTCEVLADWFERNQEQMAYYELTHVGCTSFESPFFSNDVIALGKMSNAGLMCLEAPDEIPAEEKAFNAAFAISEVYNDEKDKLTEKARIRYYINVEQLQKEENEEKNLTKRL